MHLQEMLHQSDRACEDSAPGDPVHIRRTDLDILSTSSKASLCFSLVQIVAIIAVKHVTEEGYMKASDGNTASLDQLLIQIKVRYECEADNVSAKGVKLTFEHLSDALKRLS